MIKNGLKLSEIYNKNFIEFHRDFMYRNDITFYVHKGGRGSAKSSHVSLDLVLDHMKNPVTTVIAKRYSNSLEKTVIEQVKWAINKLGVGNSYKYNKTDRTFTYLPRGNKIIFIGADDPDRIKGIKNSDFPIARFWIDELAQFKSEEELDNLKNSILREELPEGLSYKVCYSYNPPKRKHNWVNKKFETVLLPSFYKLYHTTYLENPYISKEFKIEAEHIKNTNRRKYDHEYMGLPIGNGIVPFDNLEFREITDEEINNYNNIRQGLDFGYSIDSLHFSRVHYDKTRRKIYIFGEIHQVKMSNRELFEEIKIKKWNDFQIIGDSADPKSIDELRSLGLRIIGAKKWQGSKEYGEKWLDDLEGIIIDPKRCPNTAREFENIDYVTDKDGNVLPRLVDKDNHSIDSVIYSLNLDIQNKSNGMKGVPVQV